MTSIPEILNLPDKCPVKQVHGKVTEVYPAKQVAGKNQQRFVIEDAGGNKLYISAWEHSDLSYYKGKEVIINEGPKGGLSVNVYNGKTGLNLSRTCTFQLLAVHQAQNGGGAPASDKPIDVGSAVNVKVEGASATGPQPINGAKVGMGINNAVLLLVHSGRLQEIPTENLLKEIGQLASDVIRLSNWMEQGNLYPSSKQAKAQEPVTPPPAAAPAKKEDDEDVPF